MALKKSEFTPESGTVDTYGLAISTLVNLCSQPILIKDIWWKTLNDSEVVSQPTAKYL